MMALIGRAPAFAGGVDWCSTTGGPSPSHQTGSISRLIIGSAGATDLRPHSSARSIAVSDAARVTGDRVGLNCAIRFANGALRTIWIWTAWVICPDERRLHVLQRQDGLRAAG
jgi:hypothetical protein